MLWPGAPVTDDALAAFETEEGVTLPDDYRAFLKQWNGGRPVPDGFRIPDQREGSLLDVLFRLGSEKKVSDLREQARRWQRRLPTELRPIGRDAGGNIIALGVHGERRDKVYFFDHARADLLEIASSFAAFVDGFYDPPPPS